MKISLIYPSRGRALKAMHTLIYWMVNASESQDIIIECIISIDESDPEKELYRELLGEQAWVITNDNQNVVQATNQAAKVAKGDILIYLSDDFKCPDEWDILIKEVGLFNFPAVFKVDDCLQLFKRAILTIPIMNRLAYEKLGYFFNPAYLSMFCDEDLFWTCKKNGIEIIDRFDLKFPHEHHSIGKCETDETYKRSENNWHQGFSVFKIRHDKQFPI